MHAIRASSEAVAGTVSLVSTTDHAAPLWAPSEDRIQGTNLARYQRWLADERGVQADDYASLWQWSVDNLEDFWASIWDHFDVQASTPYERVLGSREMPGAEWFTGARLSYAQHVLEGHDDSATALHHASELRDLSTVTRGELRAHVARIAGGLKALGVEPGDRVVAFIPNASAASICPRGMACRPAR